jgi:ATP-dependent Clp protease ATP-binding subunit ClpA
VLEHALVEALAHGDTEIGTEHILLGLLQEPDGIAARTVSRVGDACSVREDVMDLLGEASESKLAALIAEWRGTSRERRAAHRAEDPERVREIFERETVLKKQVRDEVVPRHNRLLDALRDRLDLAKR